MDSHPIISSDRLQLRPLGLRDLESVHALWVEPGVRRYLWDDEAIDSDRAAEVLQDSENDFQSRGFGLWGLYEQGTGDLIGFCGLRYAELFPEPELVFGLDDDLQGRGLASEAASAVLEYGFCRLALPAIGSATDAPNVASRRVLDRLGMELLGRADNHGSDTLFYRMTRDDWLGREGSRGA